MDQIPRRTEIANEVTAWCSTHGFTDKKDLAVQLTALLADVTLPQIISVFYGDAIVPGDSKKPLAEDNRRIYAALLTLGIHSADPRTLPPKMVFIPKTGEKKPFQRKWEQERFREWQKSEEGKRVAAFAAQFTSAPQGQQTEPDLIGLLLDSFEQRVEQALIPAINATIEEKLRQATIGATKSKPGVRALLEAVIELLESYLETTPDERDKLYQQHGRLLVRIFKLVDILTQQRTDREQSIYLNRMTEGATDER